MERGSYPAHRRRSPSHSCFTRFERMSAPTQTGAHTQSKRPDGAIEVENPAVVDGERQQPPIPSIHPPAGRRRQSRTPTTTHNSHFTFRAEDHRWMYFCTSVLLYMTPSTPMVKVSWTVCVCIVRSMPPRQASHTYTHCSLRRGIGTVFSNTSTTA